MKKLNKLILQKNIVSLNIIDQVINVHHYKKYLLKNKLNFFFIYIFKIFIFYFKSLFFFKNFKIIFIKINLIYIFINNQDEELFLSGIKRFRIFYSKQYIETKNLKVEQLRKSKIKGNFINYFDTAFPLHPDLIGSQNKLKFDKFHKEIVDEYLKYLDRIFYFEKKVLVFLAPRTYDAIKKNNSFKKFINNFKPKKFYFLKGVSSFLSLKKKNKKLYSQIGGQLNYLNKKTGLEIKIVKLDKKFINFFKLKLNNKDNKNKRNFLNNYKSIFLD